jgi:hypothetical protein
VSDVRRASIEAAYSRLRQSLAAREVRDEHLRTAALDALQRAKLQLQELDLADIADELERLHTDALRGEDPTP